VAGDEILQGTVAGKAGEAGTGRKNQADRTPKVPFGQRCHRRHDMCSGGEGHSRAPGVQHWVITDMAPRCLGQAAIVRHGLGRGPETKDRRPRRLFW